MFVPASARYFSPDELEHLENIQNRPERPSCGADGEIAMPAGPKATTANVICCLSYRDADRAVEWLVRAFGFEKHAVYHDPDGKVIHAELSFGNGMIMLGPFAKGEFGKRFMTMPDLAGGRGTQSICVIVDDADAHHARAVAGGAEIIMALKDEDYGGRSYSARDPEGHCWTFGTYDPWQQPPQS
jgi:uncharacterized glyoxalase superfamily protein PhnB